MEMFINVKGFFPWGIMLAFVQCFAQFNIFHAMCKEKYSPLLNFFLLFLFRVILCLLFQGIGKNFLIIQDVAMAIVDLLVLVFFSKGKLISKISAFLISALSLISSALVCSGLQALIFSSGKTQKDFYGAKGALSFYLPMFLVYCLMIIVSSFMFVAAIKLFSAKKNEQRKTNIKYAFLMLLPITHCVDIFCLLLTTYLLSSQKSADFVSISTITVGLRIVFDVSYLCIIDKMQAVDEKNIQNERLIFREQFNYQQKIMIKEEKAEMRKIKHDLANLLLTAQGFIEIGKPEKALSIIKNSNEELFNLFGVPLCSNETINTVLYIKQQKAFHMGISIDVSITEESDIKIDDYDLCRVLHNIIDNALEATVKTDNKICKVGIEISNQQIVIYSKNSYLKKSKIHKMDFNHGNGIVIIKEIAKNHNGKYTFHHEDGFYYTQTNLKNMTYRRKEAKDKVRIPVL